jgi:hypothetical protein
MQPQMPPSSARTTTWCSSAMVPALAKESSHKWQKKCLWCQSISRWCSNSKMCSHNTTTEYSSVFVMGKLTTLGVGTRASHQGRTWIGLTLQNSATEHIYSRSPNSVRFAKKSLNEVWCAKGRALNRGLVSSVAIQIPLHVGWASFSTPSVPRCRFFFCRCINLLCTYVYSSSAVAKFCILVCGYSWSMI